MNRGAGLRHQEIGPGDADVGGEILLAQHGARLLDQRRNLGQVAVGVEVGVRLAEIGLDLVAREVDGGRDDVRGPLLADLDQVFPEVGLDRFDAVRLEVLVELDLAVKRQPFAEAQDLTSL